jgi:hypothetical protein
MDRDWLALEFLMTGGLTPTRSEFEQLHSEGDLDNWLLTVFDADSHLAAAHEDLAQAIELRETIFMAIRANTEGRVPSNDHLTRINAIAAETPLIPMLEACTAGHRWQAPVRPQRHSRPLPEALSISSPGPRLVGSANAPIPNANSSS